jgi:arsenate reductase
MSTHCLWHNPRCSKSRDTLKLITSQGIEPTLRLYLQDPPQLNELKVVLQKLQLSAHQIVRTQEPPYRMHDGDTLTDDELLQLMCEHPILIERPILITPQGAALGRPPENVLALL